MSVVEGRRGVKRKKGTPMPTPNFAENGNGQLEEVAKTTNANDATYQQVAAYLTNLITENKDLRERIDILERNNTQLNELCSGHEAKLKAVAEAIR